MLKATFKKHTLIFKTPGGTSRGVLISKDSWFIILNNTEQNIQGIGECSILNGLSIDDRPDFEDKLAEVCSKIENIDWFIEFGLTDFPAIRFGLETAMKNLESGGNHILYPSEFTKGQVGIPINGLVWMGNYDEMQKQVSLKISQGFQCIKLKIGAINFEDELRLIKLIRKDFKEQEIELRVDANGAFLYENALEKLRRLSEFGIHSIEQPIKAGQWQKMAELCQVSPIAIALDEELIGIKEIGELQLMLEQIRPSYIILKPSLIGGIKMSEEFIVAAKKWQIGWWATSALESNIGLNAIAQWVFTKDNPMPQGLGTGQLFTNNIHSPLTVKSAKLHYEPKLSWESLIQ